MFKLLLVDDEPLVREAIANILDWSAMDIGEVIQAEDGELGLEIVRERIPDIVLTDIRMPFMNGLEMSKLIVKEFPHIKIVILTGHDEFEYAVQSIKLGISDYIVKPISKTNLSNIITKIVDTLKQEQAAKLAQSKLRMQLRQSLPLLKEKTLNQLISHFISVETIKNTLDYLGIDLDFNSYTVCIFKAITDSDQNIEDFEILNMSLKNSLQNEFLDNGIIFSNYENHQILILKNFDESNRAKLHEQIENHNEKFKQINNCCINTGIGITVNLILSIHESYETAKHALSYNTAFGNNIVFDFYNLGFKTTEFIYPKVYIDNIINTVLINMDCTVCLKELTDFLSNCKNLEADNLKVISFDIIVKVNTIIFKTNEAYDIGQFSILNEIYGIKTLLDFSLLIASFLDKTYDTILGNKRNKKHLLVKNAEKYIREHYEKCTLNLNEVASHVYISPSYLSALFKKETSISFVDYLTNIRIEKAKEMLVSSEIKSYEVAQRIGYQDPHYFSVCFKKNTGKTPLEYKKYMSSEHEQ